MDCYIQQFDGITNFNKKCMCRINSLGQNLQSIFLKITLPELPGNVKYKKYITYDLIKNISLEIDDITIFSYNSIQLNIIDRRYNTNNLVCSDLNKIVYYYIFINNILGVSQNKDSINQPFDGGHKGLRMCNYIGDTKLYIEFGSIYDIIEYSENMDLRLKNILGCLNFIEVNTVCNYQNGKNINKQLINKSNIEQEIITWIGDSLSIDNLNNIKNKLILNGYVDEITDVILYTDNKIDIENYTLNVNDIAIWYNSTLRNNVYQYYYPHINPLNGLYGCSVSLKNMDYTDSLEIDIKTTNIPNKCTIYILFKIKSKLVYKDGKINFHQPNIIFDK